MKNWQLATILGVLLLGVWVYLGGAATFVLAPDPNGVSFTYGGSGRIVVESSAITQADPNTLTVVTVLRFQE